MGICFKGNVPAATCCARKKIVITPTISVDSELRESV